MIYCIYLIYAQTEEIPQWKIGLSKHPEKRILELKTANPNISHIEATYGISDRAVAYKTEALIKKYLKPFKINGEWVEYYVLNKILFFEYCEKYKQIAETLIQIKNNLKYENNY